MVPMNPVGELDLLDQADGAMLEVDGRLDADLLSRLSFSVGSE